MIQEWNDIEFDNNHLLLGNGFSIGISNKFNYRELIEVFGDGNIGRYGCTKKIFKRLDTTNFEDVLKAIYHALVVSIDNKDALNTLYDDVKFALIEAVQRVHPEYDEIPKELIAHEIVKYKKIFTTNYDLILYWTILSGFTDKFIDFFWGGDYQFNYKDTDIYQNKIPVYYLHGAVHLKTNLFGSAYKTSVALSKIEDFYRNIKLKEFPLFITEGISALKKRNIFENDYLRFCYNSLEKTTGNLTIFGHSLNEDYDLHIIEAIKNSSINKIAISVYTNQKNTSKDSFIAKIRENFDGSGKDLYFYESATHPLGNLKD